MSWDYSVNGHLPQKKYGNKLVRKMVVQQPWWSSKPLPLITYYVISLSNFVGLILMETPNIREAIRFAKKV